ncbi:FUSC family protein [Actinacidiphila sp. bgisy144]|uniref:FUSC family protein n=1 Tax=Actinacidiphila sp. bgisy144 TaxID=3413791 RepID=UPI003EB80F5B
MGRLSKVFARNADGPNWPRGVAVLDVMLVPLIVFWAIGHEQYLLSALFGVVYAGVADPGGAFGRRVRNIAVFGLVGAGLTALAFGIGAQPWGWLVLVLFAVTLAAGLGVAFGVRRFAVALLLNSWFVIALSMAFNLHHHTRVTDHTWAQTASWAAGSALWIAVVCLGRLIQGRAERPQPIAEVPGDTSRRRLTAPAVVFALIRAVAIAGSAALAFGLDLSHGLWLPIATLVAVKPSLQQTALVSVQRVVGAVIGAVAALLLLLVPASEHGLRLFAVTRGLETVALVILMHGVAMRFWNYAFYTAAIAAGVLVLVDLPQPSHYSAEGYRVLWTLCGVAIGLLTMLLAGLVAKRRTAPGGPVGDPRAAGTPSA